MLSVFAADVEMNEQVYPKSRYKVKFNIVLTNKESLLLNS